MNILKRITLKSTFASILAYCVFLYLMLLRLFERKYNTFNQY